MVVAENDYRHSVADGVAGDLVGLMTYSWEEDVVAGVGSNCGPCHSFSAEEDPMLEQVVPFLCFRQNTETNVECLSYWCLAEHSHCC